MNRSLWSPAAAGGALLALAGLTVAQAAPAIPPSITTPDRVESRIGKLEFRDGAPSQATLDKVYDNVDFTHAYEAFVNTMQGVNAAALRKGFLDIAAAEPDRCLVIDATAGVEAVASAIVEAVTLRLKV